MKTSRRFLASKDSNPWQRILDWPDLKSILSRRLDILVDELGFDRQRLAGWGFIGAVLSMTWSLEDHSPKWDRIMPIAEVLYDLCLEGTKSQALIKQNK